MTLVSTPKQELIRQIYTLLGNNIVDISDHLTTEDVLTCISLSLDRYRQRAGNSQEESLAFITLEADKQNYKLPNEVMEVREIFRRGLSPAGSQNTGNVYDPFTIAYTNLYLLQAGGSYGLFTWELYNDYLETVGMQFGAKYNFTWDHRTKNLSIIRHQQVQEEVLISVYNSVTDEALLTDTYCKPWLRSYALAQAKMILGNAYEKFSQIAGPLGGVTLNGAALKAEGKEEMATLDLELIRLCDGSNPLSILIG